jgi:DNA invertase Pin-like site-specific DNA recombinase
LADRGKFVAYFRVSTDKPCKSGLGLDAQRKAVRDRNLAFIATLMDSGVEFIAVDNPHANKLTIHILAAVAQHEREMIALRTKDALQAAKARGVVLGNPRLEAVRDRAVASVKADADRFAKNVAPIIREIQSSGVASHRGIARSLNARGVTTARGGVWTAANHGVRGALVGRLLVPLARLGVVLRHAATEIVAIPLAVHIARILRSSCRRNIRRDWWASLPETQNHQHGKPSKASNDPRSLSAGRRLVLFGRLPQLQRRRLWRLRTRWGRWRLFWYFFGRRPDKSADVGNQPLERLC